MPSDETRPRRSGKNTRATRGTAVPSTFARQRHDVRPSEHQRDTGLTVWRDLSNHAARAVFDAWEKPLVTIAGRLDPNQGSDATQGEMRDTVPGAVDQPHHAYTDAGHFLQEDKSADTARRVLEWMRD